MKNKFEILITCKLLCILKHFFCSYENVMRVFTVSVCVVVKRKETLCSRNKRIV